MDDLKERWWETGVTCFDPKNNMLTNKDRQTNRINANIHVVNIYTKTAESIFSIIIHAKFIRVYYYYYFVLCFFVMIFFCQCIYATYVLNRKWFYVCLRLSFIFPLSHTHTHTYQVIFCPLAFHSPWLFWIVIHHYARKLIKLIFIHVKYKWIPS